MDVPAVCQKLQTALRLQHRSVIEQTLVAASLTGVQWQPFGALLTGYAAEDLDDVRRMAEKLVVLDSSVPTDVASFSLPDSPAEMLRQLVDHECEALSAFHAVIPDTGQEPRSEALEHRLEHLIMRKQEQIDTLRRILGETDE